MSLSRLYITVATATLLVSGLAPQAWGQSCSGLAALVDSDGDGLDDALECRLLLDMNLVDSDNDGLDDLEEVARGLYSLTSNTQNQPLSPRLSAHIYAIGDDVVVQLLSHQQQSNQNIVMHIADSIQTVTHQEPSLMLSQVSQQLFGTSATGWFVDVRSFRFSRTALEQDSSSILFVADVDGNETAAKQIALTHTPNGTWAQIHGKQRSAIRATMASPLQEPHGEGGGITTPVEPKDVPQSTPDQVCSQRVEKVGYLTPGRILWEVVEAECVDMATAQCIPDCELTVGDEFTTIDVVGLLGG